MTLRFGEGSRGTRRLNGVLNGRLDGLDGGLEAVRQQSAGARPRARRFAETWGGPRAAPRPRQAA
eukprot:2912048-Alexandrium_andersonii.AAC.1